jgi:hypothetical protein
MSIFLNLILFKGGDQNIRVRGFKDSRVQVRSKGSSEVHIEGIGWFMKGLIFFGTINKKKGSLATAGITHQSWRFTFVWFIGPIFFYSGRYFEPK